MELRFKKLLYVYNPRSGRGVIGTHLAEIIKTFESAGYIPTIYRTRFSGDATFIAETEGPKYDIIVVAGGDGTFNGVVSGLMNVEKDKRPPVGFIPVGSTNDTRSSYKLPLGIKRAASVAVNGVPFETDIGIMNDRYFTYVAAFGELSAVSAFTPQDLKNIFGHAAYISEGLKVLLNLRSYNIKVRCDDKKFIKGDFFLGMVTNATSVGGFSGITGSSVNLQDGLFELMLFNKPKNVLELTREIEAVLVPDSTGGGLVTRIKAHNIIFECDEEIQWVVDGEDAGKHDIVAVNNINKAIRVMCGTQNTKEY